MAFTITTRTAAALAALLVAAGTCTVQAQDATTPAAPPAPAAGAATAAQPEPPRNPADVVARVADQTITEGELAAARQQFAAELQQVPEAQQRSLMLDALVNMELFAKGARDANLNQGPEFQARRDFLELQALRNAYVEEVIVKSVTPEELQNAYQTLVVAQHKPEEQARARHILVETEDEAKKIIADLQGGAAFEELAKQSKDPSGQNGGDLGYFSRGQMVPPFEEAAFALEPGAVTQAPVQSEFGWHVIKLEDKRTSQPPALAEIEGELRNHLLRGKFEAALAALREKYPVEIVGQAGEAGGTAAPGGAPAPAAVPVPAGEAPSAAPASEPPAAPAGEAQPQN